MSEKNGKVLIVDDEHLSVATLKHILAHDYEVFMASSGTEALEIAVEELLLRQVIQYEYAPDKSPTSFSYGGGFWKGFTLMISSSRSA